MKYYEYKPTAPLSEKNVLILKKVISRIFINIGLTKYGNLSRGITGNYTQLFQRPQEMKGNYSLMFCPDIQVIFIDDVIYETEAKAIQTLLTGIVKIRVNYTRDHGLHVFDHIEIF